VQIETQLSGSLKHAVVVDAHGTAMPHLVLNRRRQELGSMPISREMVASAVAMLGTQEPGNLLNLAATTIAGMLGQPENAYIITRITIEEQQAGVVAVEILLTRSGITIVNQEELHTVERQVLDLLEREDINMIEFTVVDEARQTIALIAADLPSYGLKTYWIYPYGLQDERQSSTSTSQPSAQSKVGAELAPALDPSPSIENEFYIVEANQEDGTLTVTDKQTGAVFTGLNRLMDSGDIGDLYTYCPPENDLIISKPVESPKIEQISAGPVRSILRISANWSLPSVASATRAERSAQMAACPVVSEVSLTPGVRRIDIRTSINNLAKDHRLRVIFPVPYTFENVAAESTFEVRTRPIVASRPEDVSDWLELPVNTFPQKRFVDLSNGIIGLGVLNRGLPEYEIVRDESGQMAVAVTLLRCVGWLSRGDLTTRLGHAGPMEQTPEAQCLGDHQFDYALVPHNGDWQAEEALVLREAQAFNTPVRVTVSEQHPGQLPSQASLLEVEPRTMVVSAIKQSETGQGTIARVYNPLSHAVEARLRPGFACTQAFVAKLDEEPIGHPQEVPLHIGLRSGEIVTVLFQ
jgi:alpha-mannosidase